MKTFIWYGKNSKESGEILAKLIKADGHGNLPPKNFEGVIVTFGPNISDKFNWKTRTIKAVMNDPRTRTYADKKEMFDKLAAAGIAIPAYTPITVEANYGNVCGVLAVNAAEGFVACRLSGAKSRLVTSQEQLSTALADKCRLALSNQYDTPERCRVFAVGENAVSALKKSGKNTTVDFLAHLKDKVPGGNTKAVTEAFTAALNQNLISPEGHFWQPASINSQKRRSKAVAVLAALGLDFAAIDMSLSAIGEPVVFNVVTAPELLGCGSVHEAIGTSINGWLAAHNKTARERMKEMIAECSEPECAAVIEEFKRIRANLGKAKAAG